MDGLLTPVSTTYRASPAPQEPFLTEVIKSSSSTSNRPRKPTGAVSNLDDALQILKSQPEYDELVATLRFLTGTRTEGQQGKSALVAGPKSAGVVQLLVTEIATNYWPSLSEGSLEGGSSQDGSTLSTDAALFVQCLRSVTGLNSVLAQIKAFTQEIKTQSKDHRRPDLPLNLRLLLDLLAAILSGDEAIHTIWSSSLVGCSGEVQIKGQSQALVAILTSGRLQSTAAEALEHADDKGGRTESKLIGDGLEYSRWMACNLSLWSSELSDDDTDLEVLSTLFQRALSMGYQGR